VASATSETFAASGRLRPIVYVSVDPGSLLGVGGRLSGLGVATWDAVA